MCPRKIRNYQTEYNTYHGKPEQITNRSARNKARADKGLKKGDSREAHHVKPLSKGGAPNTSNVKVVPRLTNRQKYNKK